MNQDFFSTHSEFQKRHIGPNESEIQLMLKELGFSNLEEMASKVIPKNIVSKNKPDIGHGVSEFDLLNRLKAMRF